MQETGERLKYLNHLSEMRQRYHRLLKMGVCPQCGGRRDDGWIQCSSCRERNREAQHKIPKEIKQGYVNKYRDRCRKNGICYACGAWIGVGKFKRCQNCRDIANRMRGESNIRLILDKRAMSG